MLPDTDKLLNEALTFRRVANNARAMERTALLEFMRAARDDGWDWGRIGSALKITANGARQYFNRHREASHAA